MKLTNWDWHEVIGIGKAWPCTVEGIDDPPELTIFIGGPPTAGGQAVTNDGVYQDGNCSAYSNSAFVWYA